MSNQEEQRKSVRPYRDIVRLELRDAMSRKKHRPRKTFEETVQDGELVPLVWNRLSLDCSPPLRMFGHEPQGDVGAGDYFERNLTRSSVRESVASCSGSSSANAERCSQ